ncbi:hypothetical protein IQ218_14285 [Synechocystis salina LEGE 06099]|nr:hypothetical protein [Synechocystis salina]MBE9204392.1 hypothetical protein [Synechocystis salina LEGE 06099]
MVGIFALWTLSSGDRHGSGKLFSPFAVNGFRESGLPFRRPPGLCC